LAAGTHTENLPRKSRSRVSNGTAMFVVEDVDGRSAPARRYRDIVADLTSHLGCDPTAPEELLIRRVASMAVWLEQADAAQIAGREFDVALYGTTANAMRRLLADLGLQRRAKDVTPPTPDEWVARKAAARTLSVEAAE
jgi:hypothetical protein